MNKSILKIIQEKVAKEMLSEVRNSLGKNYKVILKNGTYIISSKNKV